MLPSEIKCNMSNDNTVIPNPTRTLLVLCYKTTAMQIIIIIIIHITEHV